MSFENDVIVFQNWLEEKGIKNDYLEIKLFSDIDVDYRGIVSKKTIRINEIFLKVPENLIVTTDTVWRTADLRHAISAHSGLLQPFDALCLFVMCEKMKGLNSEWFPYMNVLPSAYANPITWPKLELYLHLFPPKVEELLVTQIAEVERIKKRVKRVFATWYSDYSHLIQTNHNQVEEFDENLFLWSWTTVNTRCIYKENVTNENFNNLEGDTIAMVPFLDMINHTTDPKVTPRFSKTTKCFELVLMSGIVPENTEVFISYGPHPNSKLFVEYGFILPENSNNVVKFDVDDISSVLKEYKSENGHSISDTHWNVLAKSHLNCSVYSVQMEPSFNFLAVFRLLNLAENELGRWCDFCQAEEDLFKDSSTINMAKYFLNSYSNQLKKNKPLGADLVHLPEYAQKCILQLWDEDIFMIAQCLSQF